MPPPLPIDRHLGQCPSYVVIVLEASSCSLYIFPYTTTSYIQSALVNLDATYFSQSFQSNMDSGVWVDNEDLLVHFLHILNG